MPLGPGRVGRVGVIGHPVAKTAVVAKAVSPGPCARREDRSRGGSRDTRKGSRSPQDLAPRGAGRQRRPAPGTMSRLRVMLEW